MKLFIQFSIFPKNLTAFNNACLNLNNTQIELEKCSQYFHNFLDKQYIDNPTNQNCLFYCD